MSDRHGWGVPPARRGKEAPRLKLQFIAAPAALLLLFTTITGHVDVIGAMSPQSAKIDRVRLEMLFAEATVRAGEEARSAVPAPTEAAVLQAGATPAAVASPALADCEPSGDPRFCLYTISEGDSLAAIATRFGLDGGEVPGWELLYESNKEDLAGLDEILEPGWTLRVPTSEAVLHLVLPGDSVSAVAEDYGVTTESIVSANGLSDPDNVQIGDILLVPSPSQVPVFVPPLTVLEEPEDEASEEASEASIEDEDEDEAGADQDPADEQSSEPEPGESPSDETTPEPEEGTGSDSQPEETSTPEESTGESGDPSGEQDNNEREREQAPAPEPAVDDPTRMSWPVVQPLRITNYMSARHPLGMDFGLFYAPRSSIMAAAGGTVSFAGGDPCCSYGYYVIVDHGNGLQTLYAHLSSIAVRKGEAVSRGQSLGIAGDTGNSRGVHLHFEVYKDGKRVDPMLYLPR